MQGFSISTLNTNGIRLPSKRRALFSQLREAGTDFVMLQEVHSTPNDEKIWLSEWGGRRIFCHGKSNSKGVAILFPRDTDIRITKTIRDHDGRFLIIQLLKAQEQITLVNVYAPTCNEPNNQNLMMEQVLNHLTELQIQNLFVGGDFNIKLDDTHANSTPARDMYIAHINLLLNDYALVDVWKKKNPTSSRGTFHRNLYSARLDYLFAPEYLLPSIASVQISPEPLSDHSTVSMEVNIPNTPRGPGYWRFQNHLLTDLTFVDQMKDLLRQVSQEEEFDDPNVRWEWIKFKIREFCLSYTISKNREQKAMIRTLDSRLKLLAEKHDLSDSQDVASEVQSLKRQLSEIKQEKGNRAIFRARANWIRLGERPTSYFLGLEKRQSKEKTISSLIDEHGRTLTSNAEILAYEKRYFSNIYSEDTSQLRPVLELPLTKEDLPQVSDGHQQILNLPFTHRDFHTALKSLNKNKSPASDGITPEFYLCFWDQLHNIYYDSIMFSLERGTLSSEQRAGIVTLIPKKNQDRLQLANWRPITLLNSDFKIFSKALADRIQMGIKDVISTDQTGFIKGRTIATNLTTVQMAIDQSNISSSSGLICAIDYRKAFDTIRWELIHQALEMFGFGEKIGAAVKLLFQDTKTCILNAGFSSGFFNPSRGIRQGCCCSPSLFIIAVELLATLVRKSLNIKGINLADKEIRILQYADDATFFLNDLGSLQPLLQLLGMFATISGLHINLQKSHLLLLGHHLDPPKEIEGMQVKDQVNILGIIFRNQMSADQQYDLNFAPKIKKIKEICSTWLNRNLSFKGKVVLIQSLLSSLLQYPCSCTFTPTRVITEYKQIITEFFWNGKRGKVSYNLLIQDIAEGGIKLPDLTTRIRTIHLYWIKFLWNHPESIMAAVITRLTSQNTIADALQCKMNLTQGLDKTWTFISQILTTWATLHIYEPNTEKEVQEETLWDNTFIQIQRSPIFWTKWAHNGVKYINDLLHHEEPRFLSHTELADKYHMSVSFLEVLQIRTAIPCKWKRKLDTPAQQNLDAKPSISTKDGLTLTVPDKSTKVLYSALIKELKPKITSQGKWNEIFPVDEMSADDYWTEVYKMPYLVARDTKLQAFHFRVVHRFLPCNKFLQNIRIRGDDDCNFCQQSDTIQHFLYSCPTVKKFWSDVTAWFDREAGIQLNISMRAFLFGIPKAAPHAKVINFLALFAKFFIYRQKLYHQGSLSLITS